MKVFIKIVYILNIYYLEIFDPLRRILDLPAQCRIYEMSDSD